MENSYISRLLFCLAGICFACTGQTPGKVPSNTPTPIIGGPFENREFMEIGMPDKLNSVDTTAGWSQAGQKLLITGTIFKNDGITPAPDVLLYIYHTDIHGYYAVKPGLDPRILRHGYIRSWVKSDKDGQYSIYTVRPAAYPNADEPAHIHPSIREAGLPNAYYIDEFVFDDDPLLTKEKRKRMQNRGGSGILRPVEKGNLQIAEHNIVLGLHIPDYPDRVDSKLQSGKQVGEDILSFTPRHAWGPDKGSRTCPVCKYGRYHGILYFVGNSPDWAEISNWLVFFERLGAERKQYLKTYFIYGNEEQYGINSRNKELENLGTRLNLQNVALTHLPSFTDRESEIYLNGINPDAESTILIYKRSNVIANYVNLEAGEAAYRKISNILEDTVNDFFLLPVPDN